MAHRSGLVMVTPPRARGSSHLSIWPSLATACRCCCWMARACASCTWARQKRLLARAAEPRRTRHGPRRAPPPRDRPPPRAQKAKQAHGRPPRRSASVPRHPTRPAQRRHRAAPAPRHPRRHPRRLRPHRKPRLCHSHPRRRRRPARPAPPRPPRPWRQLRHPSAASTTAPICCSPAGGSTRWEH